MPDYRESGVDFDAVGYFRDSLIEELRFKGLRYKRAAEIGHYSGLISFSGNYLALHTDNVGTKTMLAQEFDYFDEIGYDLVGMNVNDVVCMGAEPMAMVNYIAGTLLNSGAGKKIGRSINEACREAGISMIGGETASVPDLIKGMDISGTVLGHLEKGKEITGKKIEAGDRIIGLASTGVHSNGVSLIRKIYKDRAKILRQKFEGKPFWMALLKGTRIYSKIVFDLLQEFDIHGISHITGGGVRNLLRLKAMKFNIEYPEIPPLFSKIVRDGKLTMKEAFQVFNMGIGMVIVTSKRDEDPIMERMKKFEPIDLGVVEEGKGVYLRNYGIEYDRYY